MERYYKTIDGEQVFFTGNVLKVDGYTIVNPSKEAMLAAGWQVYVEPKPSAEELLSDTKQKKLAEIAAYDQSGEVNIFYLAGQPMWLDAQTRQTLRISIDSYLAMGMETVEKWFGGQKFTFPTSAWLQMLNALEIYAAEALNVTEAHKAAVVALDCIEDVEAFDVSAGYPEKLNLTTEWIRSQSLQ